MEGRMSEIPPERPTMDDELHRAYERAHGLVDGSHGPAAAVRANVLAQVARPAAAALALAPVAAPVAPAGRGRGDAGNRPSWRLRSGATICAALVVGALSWRWEASRRGGGDTVVAAAQQVQAHADSAPRRVLAAHMLLSADARPPAPSLTAAADRGDVAALKSLLAARSMQVDAPDPAGATALLHAVRARQVAAARLLLAAGADPDRADRGGTTPRVAADPEIAALLPAPR
jgi:hypothetical protein